jgi:hypothetical protein
MTYLMQVLTTEVTQDLLNAGIDYSSSTGLT